MPQTDLPVQLQAILQKNQIPVQNLAFTQLVQLITLLQTWNQTYNLTGYENSTDMIEELIIDSLLASPYLTGTQFIDLGTGAGFPGLPLAIINPDKQFTLIDSNRKKIHFIQQAVTVLQLKNVLPLHTRIENYSTMQIDAVLTKAFATLAKTIDLIKHLPAKQLIALKGPQVKEESALLPYPTTIHDLPTNRKSLKIAIVSLPPPH